jgi:hypothetical protein
MKVGDYYTTIRTPSRIIQITDIQGDYVDYSSQKEFGSRIHFTIIRIYYRHSNLIEILLYA